MEKENKEINAVLERDLEKLLTHLGIEKSFSEGNLKCNFCDLVITKENLYSILPKDKKIILTCDRPECIKAFILLVGETKINS
ncbi:MAG: hypothetical protein WC878_06235 [Candidatus Paceibacterota bacterium]|jgi:hypothetical protein